MKEIDLERKIRGLRWPQPTDQLRERVQAARTLVAPHVTWSDRLWFSRLWRIGCGVVAAAALVVASLDRTTVDATASAQTRAEAQAVSELARTLALPPDLAAALTQRALDGHTQPLGRARQDAAVLRALEAEGERR
jgi:hypothetical protein